MITIADFDISIDDMLDFDGSIAHVADEQSKFYKQYTGGKALSTSAFSPGGMGLRSMGLAMPQISDLLQNITPYDNPENPLGKSELIGQTLLTAVLTKAKNGQIGAGVDELIPDDIKNRAQKIGSTKAAVGTGDSTSSAPGTGGSSAGGVTTAPGAPTTGASVIDFVSRALSLAGRPYLWGRGHNASDLADPSPPGLDCSGLVAWAAHQVGVSFEGTAGVQMQACIDAGLEIPIQQARVIRGAILYHGTLHNPNDEHIAISLGDGSHTIEAMGSAYGILQGDIGNRFTRGGYVPGLQYAVTSTHVVSGAS